MKTIFIMYMPGHAGNFLARLFSLGQETMPQVSKEMLNYLIRVGTNIDNIDRTSLYSFDNSKKYRTWQEFHRAWPDFEEHVKFKLLNVFYGDKKAIVHSIHPYEVFLHQQQINGIDDTEFYSVLLDNSFDKWVESSRQKLKFIWRDNEKELFDQYVEMYKAQSIDLGLMLESEQHFIEEYQRVCGLMDLIPDLKSAIDLYRNWRQYR